MNVKLISLTKPVVMGMETSSSPLSAEELLVYIARVSNPSNQLNHETGDRLIKFMIDHKHWSPFDMINMCVEVVTSKAIGIQILRHWSIKPQEFSQRYAEVTDIEPINMRLQAEKNRQSSTVSIGTIHQHKDGYFWVDIDNPQNMIELADWLERVSANLKQTIDLYQEGIQLGVAKESARMILPIATSTTMYLNGSLRSWIHYMQQRCDQHAQLEHQEVANLIKAIFIEQFPLTSKALELC